MDVGIIGLANSGRTTVFRALLAHRAPRAGGERHGGGAVGTIHVQEPRLEQLAAWFKPRKTTPVEIRIHDLCPSHESSFATGEVEAMKRMDALLLVVPDFADPSPGASCAALEGLLAELCLLDLASVEGRLERHPRERLLAGELEALERAREALEGETPVARAPLLDPQRRALRGYALVTDRPLIAVRNASEDRAGLDPPEELVKLCARYGIPVLSLCATLEAELAEIAPEDRSPFLAEYGIGEPAGAALTRAVLECADLVSFFTMNEDEGRAWPIARGTRARAAAGKIHSDMERGFIRAEVVSFEELMAAGGLMNEARKRGVLRLEGKDYSIQDGDIVRFRFNV